jgi:flagellar biosynthesis protein FliP
MISPLTHTLVLVRLGMGVQSFPVPPSASVLALILTSLIFFVISKQFHEINKRRE